MYIYARAYDVRVNMNAEMNAGRCGIVGYIIVE